LSRSIDNPTPGFAVYTGANSPCLEEGLALFDPADRPFYAALSLQDAQVMMLSFLSIVLGALGYMNQSRARDDEALAAARRLAQP